jgi:hypothetical protein
MFRSEVGRTEPHVTVLSRSPNKTALGQRCGGVCCPFRRAALASSRANTV